MPRKEYKTITVKVEAYTRFIKAIKDAKKVDPGIDTSEFLELLLRESKKSKT
ncbi:protein of unknown function [Nitrosotalea devaniterrae]|uniref:Uncharacterized protein n=1 Tax=Nitrosotalea devaniterrae TaxID=1078905 RepID=A0A128A4L9_9ARCH|nr:protein of unknown function [Candidatus Nitrosotalea devanaterra]